ncbi:mss116p [Saccharomyces arboricola H-6]|uniref:ATP-dependent RNA helicase n=1 Tax=Saccharomyces arboricola (strain H-6 / AS 2.3317 / CBS 10644) TaxID=1160507 RepID=J8Q427_SACAR|nr:mss116p [Saccharomyces arboricola H-6]
MLTSLLVKSRPSLLVGRSLSVLFTNCNRINRGVSNRAYHDSDRDQKNFGRYQKNDSNRRPGNSRFNSRPRASSRDDDEVNFDKSTFSKLIHVPKEENSKEVTLDTLLEEGVLDKELHKAIARMEFPCLTPVQQKTIKPILSSEDQDVIARAKTGTGKTFAFLIPIFQHLINTKLDSQYMVKAVIVAPTRDLALQIEAEVKKIHDMNYGLKKYACVSLVGGTDFRAAMEKMNKLRPNIVIATPGRLIDVLERYSNKFFRFVDYKVLDEADRLLEIGFRDDLETISGILNEKNSKSTDNIKTLLFSATLDDKVQKLANNIMNKKECLFLDTVDKNEPEAHERIDQSVVVSEKFANSIFAAVEHIKKQITERDSNYKAIIFAPTVKFTSFLCNILQNEFKKNLPILEFHGKITQNKRTSLVKRFKREESGILVCTDVGARGMDFPNVHEVLQIGVPSELANYIHRIGRTARSGKEGSSVLFICKEEMPFVKELKDAKNITIAKQETYEPSEEIKTEVLEAMGQDTDDLSDIIISLISSYRSCIKEYRFSERRILPEIASSYGVLLNDPQLKIPVSRRFLDKLGLSRSPIGREMFEIRDYSGNRDRSENFHDEDGDADSGSSFRSGNSYGNRNRRRDYDNDQFGRGNNNRRSFSRNNDNSNYSNRNNNRY